MSGFDIIVIGGGMGGASVAARLSRSAPKLKIAIIEPSATHLYQPLFTFAAAGQIPLVQCGKPMSEVLPKGVEWIRDAVTSIEAEQCLVHLSGGNKIQYRALVIAPGLTLDVEAIKGLSDALNDKRHPVSSIYVPSTIDKCRSLVEQFLCGTMIFSIPPTPIKCPAAPLKILYVIDDLLRKTSVREVSNLTLVTPYPTLSGHPEIAHSLNQLTQRRGIQVIFEHEISKIDLRNQEVILTPCSELAAQRNLKSLRYDFAHITPHMKAPNFVETSNLHHVEGLFKGWLAVNPVTLQHLKFINIFALGDVAGVPTMKTGSAARAQAKVVAENILSLFTKGSGVPLPAKYDGYSSCPVLTGIGEGMNLDLGYDGKLVKSFPGGSLSPSKSVWFYQKTLLPGLYWNLLSKGIF